MNSLNDLTVLFISIVLESLSFVLLGACIASLIGMFISDEMLYKLIPRNHLTRESISELETIAETTKQDIINVHLHIETINSLIHKLEEISGRLKA